VPKLKVAKTNTGKGVFAGEDIKEGTLIAMMSGLRMTSRQTEEAIEAGEMRSDDPFQIGENTFVELDKPAYYFNHCCEPNAGIRKGQELFALRNIKKGEEICFDYSTTVCTHCEWEMRCACGAKTCRKVVKNAATCPSACCQYYAKKGALPKFIARELE
jgi:SET domain-containing protein